MVEYKARLEDVFPRCYTMDFIKLSPSTHCCVFEHYSSPFVGEQLSSRYGNESVECQFVSFTSFDSCDPFGRKSLWSIKKEFYPQWLYPCLRNRRGVDDLSWFSENRRLTAILLEQLYDLWFYFQESHKLAKESLILSRFVSPINCAIISR